MQNLNRQFSAWLGLLNGGREQSLEQRMYLKVGGCLFIISKLRISLGIMV